MSDIRERDERETETQETRERETCERETRETRERDEREREREANPQLLANWIGKKGFPKGTFVLTRALTKRSDS